MAATKTYDEPNCPVASFNLVGKAVFASKAPQTIFCTYRGWLAFAVTPSRKSTTGQTQHGMTGGLVPSDATPATGPQLPPANGGLVMVMLQHFTLDHSLESRQSGCYAVT